MKSYSPMDIFYDYSESSSNDNDYDNLCGICHEKFDTEQCYTLPECNHKYHTNCIITWFRNGYQNCPHCNNNPTNLYSNFGNTKLTLSTIRNFSRNKKSPKYLKSYFNKLNKYRNKHKELKKQQKIFLNNIKSDYPSNNIKQNRNFVTKIRAVYVKICKLEFQICSLPIKTLIIPKFKKID